MGFKNGQDLIDLIRGKKTEPKTKDPIKSHWDGFAKVVQNFSYHTVDSKEKIQASFGQAPDCSHERDLAILQTIKKLYSDNKKTFTAKGETDMWQEIYAPLRENFLNHLENNRDEEALDFLNNMLCNEGTSGFGSHSKEISEELQNEGSLRESFKLVNMDSLVNFAEWLGVIPVENIEQSVWGKSVCYEPEHLFELIEKELGIEIKFPEFQKGLYSVLTTKGAFINRHIIYLYIAIRIKEFCKDIPNPRICEIGGGVGLLAYYCDLIGLKDITIVDIPSVSIVSSYFLLKNMPERKFLFSSDKDKYTDKNAIKLLFPECFDEAPDNQYDIVINCDSLPEINHNVAKAYIENIRRTAKLFYSINQEAQRPYFETRPPQNVVSKLTAEVGGFNRKSRNLFWLRRGYVEEFYEVKK